MTKIFDFIKNNSKLAIIIGLFIVAFISLIVNIVYAPNGFMPFVAEGLSTLFLLALYVLPAVLLLLKKEKEAKLFLIVLLTIWIFQNTVNYLGMGALISGNNATRILYGIFAFIEGLLFGTCLVFFILMKLLNLKLDKLLNLMLIIAAGCFFLVFVFELVMFIDNGAGWPSYFNMISETLIMPYVVISSLVYLNGDTEPVKEDENDEPIEEETTKAEEKEEKL